MTADEALGLAARLGYAAYRASTMATDVPAGRKYYDRCTNPRVGDLVLEVSSFFAKWQDPGGVGGHSIGILEADEQEPVCTELQLQEMHASGDCYQRLDETLADIPKERVFYIRNPATGELARWTNASIVALVEEPEFSRLAYAATGSRGRV